ncbi:hypothetical protein HPP92_006111 [Vanilla planifolia]|uniref:IQ domain-containing protein IQM2-like n=1 Tax=Vanilla planifolia TaxID=51239 RepID=A0A835VCW4_VANPL|nr:hypothetical protein HPP92_006111 [Vanilla planifolia]
MGFAISRPGDDTKGLASNSLIQGQEAQATNRKETTVSPRPSSARRIRFRGEDANSPQAELGSPKHEATVKLKKVYKSFRTRRQLADCVVLEEQRWKLFDFALLESSSVSFFNKEKPESAISMWFRARTRAAKVGKGLSKDENAQKLALQHWLEAIDPRHRYGHKLQFYCDCWLLCENKQPFFYWLDVGEGKEVSLEACSRLKLQQQCIKYLGPKERKPYKAIVEDGKLVYKMSRVVIDTTGGSKDAKWIFVLSTTRKLYVGLKRKGAFQHSSFLAGGAASAAGRLVVEHGILKALWPHSGHYHPTEEHFQEFLSFLEENNVDLTNVKKAPEADGEEWGITHGSKGLVSDLTCLNVDSESHTTSLSSKSFHLHHTSSVVLEDACSLMEMEQIGSEKFYRFNDRGETPREKVLYNRTESLQVYGKPEQSGGGSKESSLPSKRNLGFHKTNLDIEEQEDVKEDSTCEEFNFERNSSKKILKSCCLEQDVLPYHSLDPNKR